MSNKSFLSGSMLDSGLSGIKSYTVLTIYSYSLFMLRSGKRNKGKGNGAGLA